MPSVTRKSQGGRGRRREDIRDRLLAAVEGLLAEGHNYAEVSVERLVQEAGISRSTFYVYFEDKGELLRAWFAQITEELTGAAQDWWNLDENVRREDVHAALSRIVDTYQPHTRLMAAVFDAASYDSAVREEVDAMMAANTGGLRKHIRDGQQGGWIAPNLPPAETAGWLTWMAERGFHLMIQTADRDEAKALVEAYTDVIWNALYAFAASGPRNGARAAA
jgi:AcrR family transcriptional regulator